MKSLMLSAPNVLLLGSGGRDSGKTTFAERVIRRHASTQPVVAAKVTAIRLTQAGLASDERASVLAEDGRYVNLAESYTRGHPTALMITHGVSETVVKGFEMIDIGHDATQLSIICQGILKHGL